MNKPRIRIKTTDHSVVVYTNAKQGKYAWAVIPRRELAENGGDYAQILDREHSLSLKRGHVYTANRLERVSEEIKFTKFCADLFSGRYDNEARA